MVRSLYTGVSGLMNHQTRMDTIGHNVANVNTIGYKKDRVVFQDMLSQMVSGATKPNETKGGVNPKQVGLGMTVASIDKIMTQGSLQMTNKITDVAIQGNGFFIENKGDQVFYTRAGNFGVDADKMLVNPANGFRVQGWNSTMDNAGVYTLNTSGPLEDIQVPIGAKEAAKATTFISFASNLDSNTPIAVDPNNPTEEERKNGFIHRTSIKAFDINGNEHEVGLEFNRVGANRWRVVADVANSIDGTVVTDVGNPNEDVNNEFIVNFDTNGSIVSVEDGGGAVNPDIVNEGSLQVALNFNFDNGAVDGAGNPVGQRQTVNLNLGTVGQINGVTQFASNTTTRAYEQDGYTMGYLESFNINANGDIEGSFTNGARRTLGKIALANFTNPQGLEKAGETNFVESVNSGMANIGEASAGGRGGLVAGSLEMSNVDLSEEFTNMISTQRGFQANSRTITTTDTMLEEILRLKR